MKKIAIFALMAVSLHAGMWSTVQGMGMKEQKPKAKYTIDTAGFNPRVYEFVPVNDPSKLCVVIFGSSEKTSSVDMECFTKGK